MLRAFLILVALAVAVGAILVRLWVRGFSVRLAAKMIALAAGFVVSIKMAFGGYLTFQGEGEPTAIEALGFYGSLGLVLFFGIVTLSLWWRGTSKPSSDA